MLVSLPCIYVEAGPGDDLLFWPKLSADKEIPNALFIDSFVIGRLDTCNRLGCARGGCERGR
jgi:hypothetical protein